MVESAVLHDYFPDGPVPGGGYCMIAPSKRDEKREHTASVALRVHALPRDMSWSALIRAADDVNIRAFVQD